MRCLFCGEWHELGKFPDARIACCEPCGQRSVDDGEPVLDRPTIQISVYRVQELVAQCRQQEPRQC